MGVWLAALGSAKAGELERLLGAGACVRAGAGFALGVQNTGGEPATLRVEPDGVATASLGDPAEAGSAARINPHGPTLDLTCDPFGLHGVYTTRIGSTFWCASDLRLLRRLPGFGGEIDPVSLHGYLCFSYVPTPRTIYPGAAALPAGACLSVTPDGSRCDAGPAWREREPAGRSETEAVEELRRLLRAAVARRLGSEREVGVFLSGGLDSSLVTALASRQAGGPVHTFAIHFGPQYPSELAFSALVAQHCQTQHHILELPARLIQATFMETMAALDDPIGDPLTVPNLLLGRAAAQEARVVLNGEGGDPCFGGPKNGPMLLHELYGAAESRSAAYFRSYQECYDDLPALLTPAGTGRPARGAATNGVARSLSRRGRGGQLPHPPDADQRLPQGRGPYPDEGQQSHRRERTAGALAPLRPPHRRGQLLDPAGI